MFDKELEDRNITKITVIKVKKQSYRELSHIVVQKASKATTNPVSDFCSNVSL